MLEKKQEANDVEKTFMCVMAVIDAGAATATTSTTTATAATTAAAAAAATTKTASQIKLRIEAHVDLAMTLF